MREITNITIPLHREELAQIHAIASENGLPAGTICRQFIRHFLTERGEGRPAPIDLGAIRWEVKA